MTVAMVAPGTGRRYTVKTKAGEAIGEAFLRMIPVDDIVLDPAYQRDKNQTWITDHLPFNPQKCGALIISHRGGALYLIDGQHRWELARASGVRVIAAMVCEGLTKKQEALAFGDYQTDRRNLSAWARWRADLVAEREEAANVNAAVLKAGFKVRQKRDDDHTILTIDALRKTYRLGGGATNPDGGKQLIEDTLVWIGSTWLGEDMALAAPTIYGVALFLAMERARPEWNETYLRTAMKRNSPSKVARLAQGVAHRREAIGASPTDFAEALVMEYDKAAPEGYKLHGLKPGSRRRAG